MKGKIDPLGIEMENAMLDNNQQYLTVTITWLCEPDFNRAFHALQTYDWIFSTVINAMSFYLCIYQV